MSQEQAFLVKAMIHIARPPNEVFATFTDDEEFFALRPKAVEHRDIVPLPSGGHSCTQVYRFGRRTVSQQCTTLEFAPGERVVGVARNEFGTSRQLVTFSSKTPPSGSMEARPTTVVSVEVEGWLQKNSSMRRWLARSNGSQQVKVLLRRLKARAEARPGSLDFDCNCEGPTAHDA